MRMVERLRFALATFLLGLTGLLAALPALAQDGTVFGPKVYQRGPGGPVTVSDSFSVPQWIVAPFVLRIDNGDPAVPGAKRVTSATVTMNGALVLGQGDFGPHVAFLERPVTLGGGSNTVAVTITGDANIGAFALRISGVRLPTVVSLVPAVSSVTLGASTSLTLNISAAQTTDTTVPIAVSPSGIVSAPAQVVVPAGQTTVAVPVTAVALGQAGISASLNGTSASALVNVVPPPVAVNALEPASHTMTVGASSTFTVSINSVQLGDTQVALASDNTSVLSVPSSVTVLQGQTSATFSATALAVGNALITASANNSSKTASVHVSPQPAAIVSLLPNPLPLQQGASGSLTVTINVAQETNTTIAIANSAPAIAQTPANVTLPAGAVSVPVPVTGLQPGLANVTASVNGTSATSQVEVTVPPPVVTEITPATLTLPKGTPGVLRVTVSRAPNEPTAVSLVSSNPAAASVPPSVNIPAGALYADFPVASNAQGQATITASLNSGSATATVTISAAELASLAVSPQSASAGTGEQRAFTATGTLTDGTTEDFTARVVWTSSNTTVATIAATGVASALAAGQTTIQASFTFTSAQSGQPVTITATSVLTVTQSLTINSVSPASAAVGETITLTGTGFDPVPANNQITFRGINNTTVGSAVLTASATHITVKVPALADTGPITLTNSRGTAQSPPFTVTREQDYQLVVSPANLTVLQTASNSAQAQISSTGTKPYTGLVTLSVQGLPAGVTASFAPAQTLSAFQTGTITFTATASAAPGNYPLTVVATSSEAGQVFVRTATLNLTVAATGGATGIKGRFVTPEGQGIGGIIVRADIETNPQPQTTTDPAGNFMLVGLPAGQVTFRFDATPANPQNPMWGYTTELVAGTITQIPAWTITPPPPPERFTTISNATQTQLVTDARYPGLEITLPAGVSIVGWDGVPKTRLAVERLDPDKLPISAPPIATSSVYQIFWGTPMGGIPSSGVIPVTLPNDAGMDPGEKTELWYYDAPPTGGQGVWRMAGLGTVSADGKTITTDPGVGIPRFCGVCGMPCFKNNQNNNPKPPPPPCCDPDTCPSQQSCDPVNYATGQELPSNTDLSVAGLIPLTVSRTFHPRDPYANIGGTTLSLGQGWGFEYDVTLLPFNAQQLRLILAGNKRADFTSDGTGGFAVTNDTRYYGARITQVTGGYELKFKDGRIWKFTPFGGLGVHYLIERRDTNGNVLTIARNASGKVTNVQGAERSLTFSYGANGFINQVSDPIGRTVVYTYNAQNRIDSVRLPDNEEIRYTYVDDSEFPAFAACPAVSSGVRLKSIQMPGQTVAQVLDYGPGRRVLRETLPNGEVVRFNYTVTGACITNVANPAVKCTVNCPTEDSWENFQAGWRVVGGNITATTVVDGKGRTTTQRFNGAGVGTETVDNQGQKTTYVRDAQNRVTQKTDVLGRVWSYQYDSKGNRTKETDPLGRVTDTTYDPVWNKPTSITRYLENGTPITTRMEYDPTTGNLTKTIDPRNQETRFTYTPKGQLATILNVALNQTTTLEYNPAGDLMRTLDPLGNDTQILNDGVGRATKTTDPLAFETSIEYSALDQIVRVTDANNGLTQFGFDAKRDLRSITNPLTNTIEAYEYDARHRLTKKTDAKLKDELYAYDANGNLQTVTDRKGQVSTFTYDEQNRVATIDFGGTTQTRTYDTAGRLLEVREASSAMSYAYDNADRVVRVTTDTAGGRSELVFDYDNLNRRAKRTLTVSGSFVDETTYTYDNASRLSSISYRNPAFGAATPQTTTYTWDDGNRLTNRVLPNGIKQEFAYDGANRLLSIAYKKADDTPIETISYTYDANGQPLTKTSATSSVSETPIGAVYDNANRLTTLTLPAAGQTFSLTYDDNGNLSSRAEQGNPSNVTTYTWDTRNRLSTVTAPGMSASFAYDVMGRRTSKTVNGQTVSYVYDGVQAIGEVIAGSVSASLLTGLNLDEALARYTQAANRTYLTDALGSVIAQSKDDQTIQNFYAYSPYGEATTLGPDEGNPLQYTGRENDGTGLYYYRARYYDPILKRFISEDPIGVAGGLDFYAYVGGNPISRTDPLGLCSSDPSDDRCKQFPPPACDPDDPKCKPCFDWPKPPECRVLFRSPSFRVPPPSCTRGGCKWDPGGLTIYSCPPNVRIDPPECRCGSSASGPRA